MIIGALGLVVIIMCGVVISILLYAKPDDPDRDKRDGEDLSWLDRKDGL